MQYIHRSFKSAFRTFSLGAVVLSSGALLLGTACQGTAHAGLLTYDVTGTFVDGGTLSGYFDYNSATSAFGPYNVVTTATTDTSIDDTYGQTGNDYFAGFDYTGADSTPSGNGTSDHIAFDTASGGLGLPGEDSVLPTAVGQQDNLAYSGGASEFNSAGARDLQSGDITLAAAAPEASTAVSLGALLMLGVAGVFGKRRVAGAVD